MIKEPRTPLSSVLCDWVPMAERLPPTNTPILVCAYEGTITAAEFEHEPERNWVWWEGVGFSGSDWEWEWNDGDEHPWRGVTHWMPLPAPPVST